MILVVESDPRLMDLVITVYNFSDAFAAERHLEAPQIQRAKRKISATQLVNYLVRFYMGLSCK